MGLQLGGEVVPLVVTGHAVVKQVIAAMVDHHWRWLKWKVGMKQTWKFMCGLDDSPTLLYKLCIYVEATLLNPSATTLTRPGT